MDGRWRIFILFYKECFSAFVSVDKIDLKNKQCKKKMKKENLIFVLKTI